MASLENEAILPRDAIAPPSYCQVTGDIRADSRPFSSKRKMRLDAGLVTSRRRVM